MTAPVEMVVQQEDGTVQLTARVVPDGNRFVAVVDSLGLEGRGATADAAQQSLVQTLRGWLERQDTSGKLGAALGVDELDEETEIVLQFVDDAPVRSDEPR